METLLQSEAKASINDAAMKKVYDEAIGQMKKVDPQGQLVQTARAIGICFGD